MFFHLKAWQQFKIKFFFIFFRMVRLTWRSDISHASLVQKTVAEFHPDPHRPYASGHQSGQHGDMVLLVQGHKIPVHRSVLAVSSPYLAHLAQEAQDAVLSLVGITYSQVGGMRMSE